MRVVAFEDGYDIAAMLAAGGVDLEALNFTQYWESSDAVSRSQGADVILLDHYMPPKLGLDVLIDLLAAIEAGDLERPQHLVAMSSAMSANRTMLEAGADHGLVKSDIATLAFWPRA